MRILACAVLASAVLYGAGPQKPLKPPKVEKKVVVVQGNQAWKNTGLTIRPQDRVTITASGQVCFSSGDRDSCVGPNGWQGGPGGYQQAWVGDYLQCDDPLQGANHAALLADIGNPFFVGSRKAFSGKNGRLFLGINDCTLTGPFHNTGQFSVIIEIERRPMKP